MKKFVALFATAVALACHAARSPAPSAPPAPPASVPATPMVRAVVTVGESFRPATSDSALRAFVPEIPATDSGGECRLTRTSGNGSTIVQASFPSFDSVRTSVTLMFDSAGHLVRYSESRGAGLHVRTPPGTSEAQRDSAFRASQAFRRSSLTLDYAIDQGVATNSGGGKTTTAVLGSVRAVESLAALGPQTKRLARVRKLCGV